MINVKKIKKSQEGKLSLENKNKWISGSVRGGNPWEMISFDLCEKCASKPLKFIKAYLPK